MKNRRGGGGGYSTENSVSDFEVILPISICHEIFFRVSTRDIMQCKRVCKSWYKLLCEPDFSVTYSKKSPFTTLIVRSTPGEVLDLLEISDNGDIVSTRIKPGWLKTKFHLSSSCNGLLCLISAHKRGVELVHIINPVMGECIALPQHEIGYKVHVFSRYTLVFCPSINRFKVVSIIYQDWGEKEVDRCEIFTVGVDDRWRRVTNRFTNCYSKFFGSVEMIYLDEALHWIPHVKEPSLIETFDLAEEKAGRCLHLPCGLVLERARTNLKIFNNQLCLVENSSWFEISIWTMKEYGIVESWTKEHVVMRIWFPRKAIAFSRHMLDLVAKSQNGDIIFQYTDHDDTLTFYNFKEKKCIEIGGFGVKRHTTGTVAYEPSFLSLEEFMVR
ncbi:hypothetical protein ACJIZ3_005434 [Penstemon smallii]|uniref:F-box domain-containing protein n=1 Tax=Penstemon smallii TaxID=265156 RepID=A0ABD3S4V8_9LAMI